MANYEVDPSLLRRYLPCHTELDSFNDKTYISLVGFLFVDTKVRGLGLPFHKTFEEVNLRFYVRYKENNLWKRGVVFMKEIVPKHMITLVANTIYRENYVTHKMKHSWKMENNLFLVEYNWKMGDEWNYLKVVAEKESSDIQPSSEEEFITEHYWGYTFINESCTGVYEVKHPKWNVHKVLSYDIKCNAKDLYGSEIGSVINQKPCSVFLAEGSAIEVLKGSRIRMKI